MTNKTDLAVKIILDAWYSRIAVTDKLLDELTDEQLLSEISPKRNRGIYVLGHLTAIHDNVFTLIGLGQRLYPQLDDMFLKNSDKVVTDLPSVTDLKTYWKNVNARLAMHFNEMQTDEWFQKHNSVSNEDFLKEPQRNRLNIINTRTTHLAYHNGQLVLLKTK